jgi:hypothetical protein
MRYSGVIAILNPEIAITDLSFIFEITVEISTVLKNMLF